MEYQLLRFQVKLEGSEAQRTITRETGRLQDQIGPPGRHTSGRPTPHNDKAQWMKGIRGEEAGGEGEGEGDAHGQGDDRGERAMRFTTEYLEDCRKDRWNEHAYGMQRHRPIAQESEWKFSVRAIHKGLSKAESSMATLLRTEKIGLNQFLY